MDATDDRSRLIAATAHRLRLVQADFADEGPSVRTEHLCEEIEHALAKLVPERREGFLKELAEQFPVWGSTVAAVRAEAEPAPAPAGVEQVDDPDALVSRLSELTAGMSPERRKSIIDRLARAGLAPTGGGEIGEWSDDAAAALCEKLQLHAAEQLDPQRVLELVGLLFEFAAGLDQLIWKTWQAVSPRSEIRQPGQLRDEMKLFASGDQDVPRGQVRGDLEKTRQLIAALTSSVSQVGRQFASNYLARFLPEEISNLVKMEPGGFLVGHEVKCWRKYTELSRSLSVASVENEMISVIAKYAESLMKGIGR